MAINPLDAKFHGIRIDQTTRQASVYDVTQTICDCDAAYASRIFTRLDSEYMTKCHKLRINGKGRETPVADARTLVQIIWVLPGKKARSFRVECADYICRVLGGDATLIDEMRFRAANTPQAQRDFFLPQPKPADDDEEYLENRMESAIANVEKNKLISSKFPKAKRNFYVEMNGMISKSALGKRPRQFLKESGILKKRKDDNGKMVYPQRPNGRDIMTTDQLAVVRSLEGVAKIIIKNEGTTASTLEKMKEKCSLAMQLYEGLHGSYIEPATSLEDVKEQYKSIVAV